MLVARTPSEQPNSSRSNPPGQSLSNKLCCHLGHFLSSKQCNHLVGLFLNNK